jgi:hypothetical protein
MLGGGYPLDAKRKIAPLIETFVALTKPDPRAGAVTEAVRTRAGRT